MSENKINSLLETFLFGVSLYLLYILLMKFIGKLAISSSSCGCKQKKNIENFKAKNKEEILFEDELTAKDKACLAVGICDEREMNILLTPDVKHKWKNQIIKNAEKIFGKSVKSELSKVKKSNKKNKI